MTAHMVGVQWLTMEVISRQHGLEQPVVEPRLHALRLGDQSASGDDSEEEQK
jgi:hypothetical protein